MMVLQNKEDWPQLEKALQQLISGAIKPKETECTAIEEALGRVLAEDVYAKHDNPPFNRSPLDGYALRSEDSCLASAATPVKLAVTQEIFAGDTPRCALNAGEAARIMTGAMLPQGADCVIKQEETQRIGSLVQFTRALKTNENVVFQAEDVHAGKQLLEKGRRLGPAEVALLAGQGISQIRVFMPPCVAVAATGNELIKPSDSLETGKIYDSNSFLLAARCKQLFANVSARCILPDDPMYLQKSLDTLLQENQLVITTGGVSVGEKDYLPEVAKKLGGTLLFHGVKVRPGGPALALVRGGHVLLCLSGNPFAALATFEVLAVPVLKKLAGEEQHQLRTAIGIAQHAFSKASPMRRLLRARIQGQEVHIPPMGHASGSLFALQGCNCLVDIPAGSGPVAAGDTVKVILFD